MAHDSAGAGDVPPMIPPRGPEHKRLQVFVGKWCSEGQTRPTAFAPSLKVHTIDEYTWFPGEYFLLHRITTRVGDEETRGIEIIGYDEDSDMYPAYLFDDKGAKTVSQLRWREDSIWTIAADTERATIKFDESCDAFTAAWERRHKGAYWQPWMDVKLKKTG